MRNPTVDHRTTGDKGGSREAFHLNEDRCLDLLHGLLEPIEQDQALRHLQNCRACEERFQGRVAERERLRARWVVRTPPGTAKAAPKRIRDLCRRSWSGLLGGFRRPLVQAAVGCGAVAAIICLFLLPHGPRSSGVADLVVLPVTELVEHRGAEESTGLKQGLEAYQTRQYERAVELFRQARVPDGFQNARKIYLASALAWCHRFKDAVAVFDEMPPAAFGSIPPPTANLARWTQYVSLREAGAKARANSLLRELAKEEDAIGARARTTLGTP
jgi:hypothetical protein